MYTNSDDTLGIEEICHSYDFCNDFHIITDKRQQELTNAQDKAPPRSYLEAMEALLKWVTHMESLLASEKMKINEAEVMEEQLKQYKVLINRPI